MIRTFTGYKGKMAAAQIGDIKFVLLCKNGRQLETLWSHIMNQVALDPAGVKSAILIEAATLPNKVTRVYPSVPHNDALDRLNAELAAETISAPSDRSNTTAL